MVPPDYLIDVQRPPPAPQRELQPTPKNSVKVPVAKASFLKRQSEAGSARLRERSEKDLKRSWSRSKLNPKPSPPREVEVIEDDHFTPDWEAEQSQPIELPTPFPQEVPSPFTPPQRLVNIGQTVERPPRLRVALD